ncbi:phosphoribosyltransferase family protein [Kribbella sp. NPDC051770]|uniref:ComF family protein n=1 Tax=Kribbella sp. NPDC051770 TaxID=3155413 RepID=UPI0034467D27
MGLRDAWVDLLLGGSCAGCARPGVTLCLGCRAELAALTPFPAAPTPVPPGFPPATACAPYEGVLRRLLLEHKEHARYALAEPLGRTLATAVAAAISPGRAAWLCPIPSARATVRARGHEPLRRIAIVAARHLSENGYDVRLAAALKLLRRPADQAGLSAQERIANVEGVFGVRSRWAETLTTQPVLLVDDVLTTGSTLSQAAGALETTGIAVLGSAVLAATRRHATPGS